MRIVETATEAPGTCALTGTSQGPFVQTELLTRFEAGGGTQLVSVAAARELAVAIGAMLPGNVAELRAQAARAGRLELALAALHAEHVKLVDSVGYTLKHGAVARGKEVVLRPLPGKPRVDVP